MKALSIVAFLMRSVQSENGHSALPFYFWKKVRLVKLTRFISINNTENSKFRNGLSGLAPPSGRESYAPAAVMLPGARERTALGERSAPLCDDSYHLLRDGPPVGT